MPERQPVAFFSYVQSDDNHDSGRISQFRQRLEGEVKMQTGKPFSIFQDRNDILWGQQWESRIIQSLNEVTFLIPIMTPSFFESPACRSEFKSFLVREQTLGFDHLILPLYYVSCDQLTHEFPRESDELADILRDRQWTDWRQYRFKPFNDETVSGALAKLGEMIKHSMRDLALIEAAASSGTRTSQTGGVATSSLEYGGSEGDIKQDTEDTASNENPLMEAYHVDEARPGDALDRELFERVSKGPYYAYTRRFDEVAYASVFAEPAELLKLHGVVSRLSEKIKTKRRNELAKYVSQIRSILASKQETISLSILIDNSGSMRGEKILHTSAWSLVLVELLESFGIRSEILGFTTRAWKGGQSREMWLADGKPPNPGRLNDLRYVIFKSFSDGLATATTNIGAMARDGLLKENIDGEALLWASARLRKERGNRKLIFVISDGAPVDDSTLSVNPGPFLEKHLKAVAHNISSTSSISLKAIGLEYDVARYYSDSVVADNQSLGIAVLHTLLGELETI